jgi:hypothetical protein
LINRRLLADGEQEVLCNGRLQFLLLFQRWGPPEVIAPLAPTCVLSGTGNEQIAAGLDQTFSGRLPIPAADICIEYVRKQFSWSRIAHRVRAVYEETVAEAR